MSNQRQSFLAAVLPLLFVGACTTESTLEEGHVARAPKLLVELPAELNTPDGVDIDAEGNIFLSIPNFNNDHLVETGVLQEPAPPVIVRIDAERNITKWYTFAPQDLHPETGRIGPMGIAFGPDGHLYVADMQALWSGDHDSRLLRINIEGGRPVGMDVVVEGFIAANGMVWKDETLFVTESILAHPPPVSESEPKPPLPSGVYGFTLEELQAGPIELTPRAMSKADSHLVLELESGNSLGFGADGVTVDGAGNLYTSVVEDGRLYRTTLGPTNEEVKTVLFAHADEMKSSDGIVWAPADDAIYVADLLGNAVHMVDMRGKISILHRNGDTDGADGSLDEPVEVRVRGRELIVVNMDIAWLTPPGMAVNTSVDQPYTLSVIELD